MTKLNILHAGFVATAMLMTPAVAQEATQEPGAMGQHYPEVDYLTGGYGSRGLPGRAIIFGVTIAGSPMARPFMRMVRRFTGRPVSWWET